MPLQLTVQHLSGSKKGLIETFDSDRITVGRNPTNTLAFDAQQDLDVSAHHAQIMVGDDGKYHITDLGSSNGTFLNGTKIASTPVPLEPGSTIQFAKNGPQVRIDYQPGPKRPGATRVMLAQVQQQLEASKSETEKKSKKLVMTIAMALVVIVGGGIAAYMYLSGRAKKDGATTALDNAANSGRQAKDFNDAHKLAPKDFKAAQELHAAALAKFDEGGYEEAKKLATEANDGYLLATKRAVDAKEALEKEATADLLARLAKQQEAMEEADRRAREADEERKKQIAMLEEQARVLEAKRAAADAAEKKRIDEELAKVGSTKTALEKTDKLRADFQGSVVFIHAEAFVQAAREGAVRQPIVSADGVGFVLPPDGRIATCKHVVEPWKYDKKALARLMKYKEEHGYEVQEYVEVYVMKGGKYQKAFDTASKTLEIAVRADDVLEPKSKVTIRWSQLDTDVEVAAHKADENDIVLLRTTSPSGVTPVKVASAPLKLKASVAALGATGVAEGTGAARTMRVNPAGGQLGQANTVEPTRIVAALPDVSGLHGAPLLDVDGNVVGMVLGGTPNAVQAIPIKAVTDLKMKAGTASAGGGSPSAAGAPSDVIFGSPTR